MATTAPSTNRTTSTAIEYELKRDVVSAVLTGQLAGLIMAVAIVFVFSLILGTAWYHPVQVIGASVLGDRALPGTFYLPGFLAGLAMHQLIATVLWSLVFGLLINRLEHNWTNVLAVGLAIGALSHVIDVNFVVPAVYNGLHGHNIWAENVPNFWSWIAHVAFGLSFLLFVPIWKRLPDRNIRASRVSPTLGHHA